MDKRGVVENQIRINQFRYSDRQNIALFVELTSCDCELLLLHSLLRVEFMSEGISNKRKFVVPFSSVCSITAGWFLFHMQSAK